MREGVKMILLISPHNPVGRVWTRDELERMAELCIRYDALIVSDDIHADFIHEGHEHTVIAKLSEEIANRSIICTSPGKTFNLASLEIANIIIPNDELRGGLSMVYCRPEFIIPHSSPCLRWKLHTSCDEWLTELRAYIKDNIAYARTFIADHMPELAVIDPEGTYLLWIDCTAVSRQEEDLVEWIQEKRASASASVPHSDPAVKASSGSTWRRALYCRKASSGLPRLIRYSVNNQSLRDQKE